jgi:HPt (histidine-containing phosphotransfer) domain-containing protein
MNQGIYLSDSVLDVAGTLVRLGGDGVLYGDLIEFLLVDAPQCFGQLQRAVEMKDAEQAKFHAHSLKGLVAGCGGFRAAGAAQQVEHAAQTTDFDDLKPLMESLQKELESLQEAIADYRTRTSTARVSDHSH